MNRATKLERLWLITCLPDCGRDQRGNKGGKEPFPFDAGCPNGSLTAQLALQPTAVVQAGPKKRGRTGRGPRLSRHDCPGSPVGATQEVASEVHPEREGGKRSLPRRRQARARVRAVPRQVPEEGRLGSGQAQKSQRCKGCERYACELKVVQQYTCTCEIILTRAADFCPETRRKRSAGVKCSAHLQWCRQSTRARKSAKATKVVAIPYMRDTGKFSTFPAEFKAKRPESSQTCSAALKQQVHQSDGLGHEILSRQARAQQPGFGPAA